MEALTGSIVGSVAAGVDVTATVSAAVDINSVAARRHITGDIGAGRDVGTVFAGSFVWTGPDSPPSPLPPDVTGDVTGMVTAGRDIGSVRASNDIKSQFIIAGQDIEAVSAGRDIGAGDQFHDPFGEGSGEPVTIEATAGYVRRVVAQGGIGAVITAGTNVGEPLNWPAENQLTHGEDDFVGPPYPWGPWWEFPYAGYPSPTDLDETGVLAGGSIMVTVKTGSGDVRLVSAGGAAKVDIEAGRNVGAVGGRLEVKGDVAAAGSVGSVWSGLGYPYQDAGIGNVRAKVTAGGFIASVGAWGGSVEGTIKAGTDVGSVSASAEFTGTVEAGSDVGTVSAQTGAISGPITATKGDIQSVSAGTSITSDIKAGDDIWTVVSGTKSGGGIKGSIKAGDDIGDVTAYGASGAAGGLTGRARPEDPTNALGDELDRPLWTIDPAVDLYLPGALPTDRPQFPNIPIGGNIDAVITADAGDIASVTAFGTLKGEIKAAKTIGHGTNGAYPSTGVWAADTIESPVTAGEGSLVVRGWNEIKGNVETAGDLQSWAYGDLLGDLKSTEGTIFAGSWSSLASAADANGWVDVRAFNNVGQPAADPDAPAAGKALKSATNAARVWAGQSVTSAVEADKYAAVYAVKGVSIADGPVRSNTEDVYIETRDEDIAVQGGSIDSGGVKASDLVWLQAGRDIAVDAVQSTGGDLVADADRSVTTLVGGANRNVWVAGRTGSAKPEVTATEGWGYAWASTDLSGSVTAKKTVSATGWGSIDATLTSKLDGVDAWSAGALKGTLNGALWVKADAHGTVSASVDAGASTFWADATVRSDQDITGPITAMGDADLTAVGSIRANVTAAEGSVTATADGDIDGVLTGGTSAEVDAGGWVKNAVTATEHVLVKAAAGVTAAVESRERYVTLWSGGSVAGSVKAGQEVILEAKGSVGSEIVAGTTASVLADGNVTGAVTAKWSAEIRSLTGVYPAVIDTAPLATIAADPDSPTNRRLAVLTRELARTDLDPARRADLQGELEWHQRMLDGKDLNFDPEAIDESRITPLVAEGKNAKKYDRPDDQEHRGYVVLNDVAGAGWYYMILKPYGIWEEKVAGTFDTWEKRSGSLVGNWMDDSTKYRNVTLQFYQQVNFKQFDLPPTDTRTPDQVVAQAMTNADNRVQAFISGQETPGKLAAMKAALHMVPLAGTIDHALDGNWWDAGVSLASDLALFTGFGAVAAARGIVCASRAAKVVRFLNTTAMAMEGAAAATQIGRGFHAMYTGNKEKQWEYFGDATLRLLGLSVQAISWLRNRPLCFVAGTPVHTDVGLRPIEQVRTGDRVWAYDRHAQEWRFGPVTKTFERVSHRLATVRLAGGDELTGTDRHPVWVIEGEDLAARPAGDHGHDEPAGPTPGRWVALAALRAGDAVLVRKGRVARVTEVVTRDEAVPVYNFEVAGLHSYAVGRVGVLVHNGDGPAYDTGRLAGKKAADRTKAAVPDRDPGTSQASKHGANAKATEAPPPATPKPTSDGAARPPAPPRANSDPRMKYKYELEEIVDVNGRKVKYLKGDLESTPELKAALQQREAAVDAGVGVNEASEALGEIGAEQYMTKRLGATRVPKPANTGGGQYDLDQIYKLGDDLYVVECKGGPKAIESGRIAVPKEKVVIDGQEFDAYANEGSRKYLEMTLKDMAQDGSPTRPIALELQDALDLGKLRYINVKTIPKGADKATFTVKHYNLGDE